MCKQPKFLPVFLFLLWNAKGHIIILIGVVIAGGFFLSFEGYKVTSCNNIAHSYLEAIYAAFITALTIGYGDIIPAGPIGRIVAVILGIVGMMFVGVVVGATIEALKRTS